MSNQSSEEALTKGCLILMGIIAAGFVLMELLRVLMEFLNFLLIFVVIAAPIAVILYFIWLNRFEISDFFSANLKERTYDIEVRHTQKMQQGQSLLTEAREDKLISTLNTISDTLKGVDDKVSKQGTKIESLEQRVLALEGAGQLKDEMELKELLKAKPQSHG